MSNKSILISSLAAAAVIGGLAYWMLRGDEAAVQMPKLLTTNTVADTIESAPEAAERSSPSTPRPANEAPSNSVTIRKILKGIKVDESGHVVPDQTMKEALEEGFDDLGPNVTAAAMAELQKSIRAGLPGQAGDEAAQILENYYRFRLAETEFEGQPVSESLTDRYEKLLQLRRSYLGAETADKLFAVENANGRHMLATIAIQTNPNLSAAEKQTQQNALQEKLNERLLSLGLLKPEEAAAEKVQRLREQGASNADIYATRKELLSAEGARDLAVADREEATWQSRFNGFWQARRYIVQAGLEEAERERQIEQLLEQYFGPEERERARLTSFDWQARDVK